MGSCGGRENHLGWKEQLQGPCGGSMLEVFQNQQGIPWAGRRGLGEELGVCQRHILGEGVGQITQDSLGVTRALVFTLSAMEPLGSFVQRKDNLVT